MKTDVFMGVFLFSPTGIHKLFHCAPNVPHYAKNKAVGVMKKGHAFTIEPMISQGSKANYVVQEAKESFASLDLSKMAKFILKIMY